MESRKACGTCLHNTPIGGKIPAHCAGCINLGECTKWEALRLEATKEDIHKSTT